MRLIEAKRIAQVIHDYWTERHQENPQELEECYDERQAEAALEIAMRLGIADNLQQLQQIVGGA